MLIISDEKIRENLSYPGLIDALKRIFQSNYTMPLRHHHFYKTAEGKDNTLILMPVWNHDFIGMKQVTVAPANTELGIPSIFARYILSNARTGEPLAMMNAAELTSRRTACTSALAADYLARKNAKNLLIVGSGKVAQHLAFAYAAVRQLEKISIWARNTEKMHAMVAELQAAGLPAQAVENLETAVKEADVVSCATLSETPIIKGAWVQEGTHLDMIGSHKPNTREADNEALLKSTVFVDSRMGALHETGDLAIPIAEGIFKEEQVKADITELIRGEHPGRSNEKEITFFKSAGLAVEDLAAALLVYEQCR
jgi:ornithine cyclodeaminase/alanine dehydrogenase-like protein (mu-crystallin family)